MAEFGSRLGKKGRQGYGGEGYGEGYGGYGDSDDEGDYHPGSNPSDGNTLEFNDLKFSEDKDTIVTCKVPPKLSKFTVTMDA